MPTRIRIPDILPRDSEDQAGRLDFSWVRPMHRVRTCLATAGAIFCLLALLGVYDNLPFLFSVTLQAPGTHPVTSICGLLLAVGVANFRPYRRTARVYRICVALAFALAVLRLTEVLLLKSAPVSAALLPAGFAHKGSLSTGVNTALTIAALSLAIMIPGRTPHVGLTLVALAMFLPTVTMLGYLYGLDEWHGAMSAITAIIYLCLAAAAACLYTKIRVFRILLRGDILGRLARWQILLSNVFFITSGYVFIKIQTYTDLPGTAIIVAMAIWFVTGMIIISTQHYDLDDRRRRKRERELLTESLTDSLTGLANRRGAHLTGHAAFDTALQDDTPLSALAIDLDNFKEVNDTYGHAAGDAVLREVADLMSARLRRSDILARWGGEEFLVLLPGAGSKDAAMVAEELRDLVEGAVTPPGGLGAAPVTISVGVSELVRTDHSLSKVIERADQALYAAKEGGRNAVVSCRDLASARLGADCPQSGAPCDSCPLHGAPVRHGAGDRDMRILGRPGHNHDPKVAG